MKKNPKEAFGIFQDGESIRMVHLKKDGADTYLLGMDFLTLEKDWYKEEAVVIGDPDADYVPMAEDNLELSNLDFGDLDDLPATEPDYDAPITLDDDSGETEEIVQPRMETSPVTLMLSKYPMSQGVIALNVCDHNLQKDEYGATKKSDIKKFRKAKLTTVQRKADEWASCVVEAEAGDQHWLHTGPNMLLDAIIKYGKTANSKLYFQFVDAIDIALTNFYSYLNSVESSGIRLFVYLGKESRKAYVFSDGKWTHTLPIYITQDHPEPDIIYSKLALALDSAQIEEPSSIVVAGEYATRQLVDYMAAQSASIEVSFLSYPNLITGETENPDYEREALAPYALALALAYKALNLDSKHFCKCNFLPIKILDSQKELRVVWHGFIVLSLIFIVVFIGTRQNLLLRREGRVADMQKSSLTFTLNRLKAENAVIEQLNSEILKYKEITFEVVDRLEGKNRWTELFNLLNGSFNTYKDSWISNLRQADNRIAITGVCSRRDYVSRLADTLPQSRISSVTRARIRNRDVWAFEMDFAMPEVDWAGIIEQEYQPPPEDILPHRPGTYRNRAISRDNRSPISTAARKSYRYGILPRIRDDLTPGPIESELNENPAMMEAYRNFITAISKGNMLEYRFMAHVFINEYPESKMLSMIRWWTAYRLYVDRDILQARYTLQPNVKRIDDYQVYSLLLEARIAFALGEPHFEDLFQNLIRQYPKSPAATQARLDLKLINEELIR